MDEKKFYTQKEISKLLDISSRMLIYWEKQGIISSGVKTGKTKRYSKEEIEKIRVIIELLKKGYPLNFLKKLKDEELLNIENFFWDIKEEKLKTKQEIAEEYLKNKFLEISSQKNVFESLINYFFEILEKYSENNEKGI